MPDMILISACLLGRPLRYDGRGRALDNTLVKTWQAAGLLVPICPEVAAGLPTPRPPAEITAQVDGADVWGGQGGVCDSDGADLTPVFRAGAQMAVDLARRTGCRFALLAEASPSCGVDVIYSGHHDGQRRAGQGVTTAALRQAGVQVFPDHRIDDLARALAQ